MSNSANISIKLGGTEFMPPKNWFDIGVLATFDNEVQANITIQDFDFILDAYTYLKEQIDNGLISGPGIFEPVPFSIDTFSSLGTYLAFEGGVDLSTAKINETQGTIQASLSKDMSLNTLEQRLSGLTYALLEEKGVITSSDYVDVEYTIVKIDQAAEALITATIIFLMAKQLFDTAKEAAIAIVTVAGIAASGLTGALGAAIFAAGVALANIAYAALMLTIIIQLGKDVLAAFLQPVRTHKGIYLKTLLEKACTYLGYGFNTTITDLDNIIYLPSNQNVDIDDGVRGFLQTPGVITKGIPNPSDYGYKADEIFRLCKDTFYSRYQLINNTVQLHAENSPFWERLAPWNFPDVLEGEYRYNTNELNASVLIKFATDVSDTWTIGNYKGTAYQVITSPNTPGPIGRSNITGLDEVALPVALASRKESLTGFENFLKTLGGIIDSVTGVFGGGTNFAGQISGKVGTLKVSTNNHTVPKLIWLEGNRIPANHRDLFSAKTLWEKYHNYKSFVANNYKRQRKEFEDVLIPFGFADFLQLIDNSYFITSQGDNGKVVSIEWNMIKDTAKISYWIEKPYTKNLVETFIEPE